MWDTQSQLNKTKKYRSHKTINANRRCKKRCKKSRNKTAPVLGRLQQNCGNIEEKTRTKNNQNIFKN